MTPTLLIEWLIINCFFIHGVRAVTSYEIGTNDDLHQTKYVTSKKLFWFVKYYGLKWLGEFWMQPICTCTVCMSSLWGLLFYFTFVQNILLIDSETFVHLPMYLISLAGLNFIAINFSR